MEHTWIDSIGLISAIALPFFNIPLIIRMVKRKSSEDLSLIWVFGVFFCLLGLTPAAWTSSDPVFKAFSIVNLLFFSGVTFLVVFYRKNKK